MMSPLQAMTEIARLLERAMEPDAHPMDVRGSIVAAHTHAVLQVTSLRRAEARATFAAFPGLEQGPLQ